MKTAIAIILALFALGCSDYTNDKAQQSEPQETVGEMGDEDQRQYEEPKDQEALDIPLVEDTNYSYGDDEADPDESMLSD